MSGIGGIGGGGRTGGVDHVESVQTGGAQTASGHEGGTSAPFPASNRARSVDMSGLSLLSQLNAKLDAGAAGGEVFAKKGDQGDHVQSAQNMLAEFGALLDDGAADAGTFRAIVPDGEFGPKTERAILTFQRNAGLEETGTWNAETEAHMKGCIVSTSAQSEKPSAYAVSLIEPGLKKGEASDGIKVIQMALKKLATEGSASDKKFLKSLDPGKIDGTFNAATEKALKALIEHGGGEKWKGGTLDQRALDAVFSLYGLQEQTWAEERGEVIGDV